MEFQQIYGFQIVYQCVICDVPPQRCEIDANWFTVQESDLYAIGLDF